MAENYQEVRQLTKYFKKAAPPPPVIKQFMSLRSVKSVAWLPFSNGFV